jgi:GNAT superfamily N-acetyltransferase
MGLPEDFKIATNLEPFPGEILQHYVKLWEYTARLRPDLKEAAKGDKCSITVNGKDGKPVAGAYLYSSLGLGVLESIWVAPEHRGQGLLTQVVLEILRVAKERNWDQIIGYSADFLGTHDIVVRYGGELFAELPNPSKGYTIKYFRYQLK